MLAERTIKKHVVIIHAYSLMSTLQRKIVNVLLYEASKAENYLNHKESVAVECRIPFANLSKILQFNSNNTQYLKEAIDELASLKIEWNLLKDKVPTNISFLNLRILHGPPTFYQDHTLNFSFHKVMLEMINNPTVYGTINIDVQSKFESRYGHALYENSTRFVNLHKNLIIQLDTFKKILGVHESKYLTMRELSRNVIKPSMEEVNDRADFVVHLRNIKKGRKITGFELEVNDKKKSPVKNKPINLNENIYNEIKENFGELNENTLETILKSYSDEYIYEKIVYTKRYVKKESTGFYPIPYFISALKNDYKLIEGKNDHQPNKDLKENDKRKNLKDEILHLQSDLNHWNKMLEYANISNNHPQINTINKVISECEKKLRNSHLKYQKEE